MSIVHNDLKLDNCQFDPADPDRVLSIFDWDMTTLGDPLIDVGTLLNYWPDPGDSDGAQRASNPGLTHMGLLSLGIERLLVHCGTLCACVIFTVLPTRRALRHCRE